MCGQTGSNAGFMEIATADDTNEPIFVRQYGGQFATIARTLTLLDAAGNTIVPGTIWLNLVSTANPGTGIVPANTQSILHSIGNDFARILTSGSSGGYYEIGTSNNRPIHIRQFGVDFVGLTRTLTLLDANGNTMIPGSLTVSNRNVLNDIDNRSVIGHPHTIADITNLQTELNNRSRTNHTHSASDITSGILPEENIYIFNIL